jgi:type I restriction enzyme S subunit
LKYIPKRDDIYMIKSGATTGRVAIVDTDRVFTIWSPLAVFRCNQQRAKPRYLFYYLQSFAYQGQVELAWSFGTQQNIGMRALEELKVALPPLPEQQVIADYLDEKCAAIDAMVAEKEVLIADLEAYKKSLIYETVTGKREVASNSMVK